MPNVEKQTRATRDIDGIFDYLAEEAGPTVAKQFIENAETTFSLLAGNPGIGTPMVTKAERLNGLRRWLVDGFERYLIYYLPQDDGVKIVHVRHSSHDQWKMIA